MPQNTNAYVTAYECLRTGVVSTSIGELYILHRVLLNLVAVAGKDACTPSIQLILDTVREPPFLKEEHDAYVLLATLKSVSNTDAAVAERNAEIDEVVKLATELKRQKALYESAPASSYNDNDDDNDDDGDDRRGHHHQGMSVQMRTLSDYILRLNVKMRNSIVLIEQISQDYAQIRDAKALAEKYRSELHETRALLSKKVQLVVLDALATKPPPPPPSPSPPLSSSTADAASSSKATPHQPAMPYKRTTRSITSPAHIVPAGSSPAIPPVLSSPLPSASSLASSYNPPPAAAAATAAVVPTAPTTPRPAHAFSRFRSSLLLEKTQPDPELQLPLPPTPSPSPSFVMATHKELPAAATRRKSATTMNEGILKTANPLAALLATQFPIDIKPND